jgi:hypothetical protein
LGIIIILAPWAICPNRDKTLFWGEHHGISGHYEMQLWEETRAALGVMGMATLAVPGVRVCKELFMVVISYNLQENPHSSLATSFLCLYVGFVFTLWIF